MKRLLFISHRVPYPPDKGERVRAFNEIVAMSEHFRVTLAALSHGRADMAAAQELQRWCENILVAPAGGKGGLIRGALSLLAGGSVTEGYFRSRRLRKLIAAESAREPFALVMGYSSSTLPYVLAAAAFARVIDLVDVDSAKWSGYAEAAIWPKSWLYRWEAAGVGKLERRAVERCDAVLLVSQAESAALGFDGDKVMAVANGVDADFFAPGTVEPADLGPASLVFTGTMDYRPNVEGVCWFVREVWPKLKRQVPELTLTIVGRDPTSAVRRLARHPGVSITGSVRDVRPYLAGACVAICPLQTARGIQNKVLEAMAAGKAVVASPGAIEGLEVEIGKHLIEAHSSGEWQKHILYLLTNNVAREDLGRAARDCVRGKYTWASRMARLVRLCRKLCEVETSAGACVSGPVRSDGEPSTGRRSDIRGGAAR